jgi:hypothetical protein
LVKRKLRRKLLPGHFPQNHGVGQILVVEIEVIRGLLSGFQDGQVLLVRDAVALVPDEGKKKE